MNGYQLLTKIPRKYHRFFGPDVYVNELLDDFMYLSCRFSVIPINPLINPLDASGDKPGVLNLVGKGVGYYIRLVLFLSLNCEYIYIYFLGIRYDYELGTYFVSGCYCRLRSPYCTHCCFLSNAIFVPIKQYLFCYETISNLGTLIKLKSITV